MKIEKIIRINYTGEHGYINEIWIFKDNINFNPLNRMFPKILKRDTEIKNYLKEEVSEMKRLEEGYKDQQDKVKSIKKAIELFSNKKMLKDELTFG